MRNSMSSPKSSPQFNRMRQSSIGSHLGCNDSSNTSANFEENGYVFDGVKVEVK